MVCSPLLVCWGRRTRKKHRLSGAFSKSKAVAGHAELFRCGDDLVHHKVAPGALELVLAVPAGELLTVSALDQVFRAAIGTAGVLLGDLQIALDLVFVIPLVGCAPGVDLEGPGPPPVPVLHALDPYADGLVGLCAFLDQYLCFHGQDPFCFKCSETIIQRKEANGKRKREKRHQSSYFEYGSD